MAKRRVSEGTPRDEPTYVRVWEGLRKEKQLDLRKITNRRSLLNEIKSAEQDYLEKIRANKELMRKYKGDPFKDPRIKSLKQSEKFVRKGVKGKDIKRFMSLKPVTQRSGRAGWTETYSRRTPSAWGKGEVELLRRHSKVPAKRLVNIFAESGYSRTASMLYTKKSRLGL